MPSARVTENDQERQDARRRSSRDERYRLRRISWQVSNSRTLRGCGRGTRGDTVGIHKVGGRATATGLVTCSSVWACPVCSAHIRQTRAAEIDDAARLHLAAGGGLLMLTLTLRHRKSQRLGDLLDGLLGGWRQTIMGSPWKRRVKRHGVMGQVRAVEVTHGGNGWHPHLHVLLFLEDRTDSPEAIGEFESWLHARWARIVMERGLGRPSRKHGVKLQAVREGGIGQYVAKVQDGLGAERGIGLEIARGDLKNGRAAGSRLPFELLASVVEDGDLTLWREYVEATKGRRAIEWTPKLRQRLGLGQEATDQEITADTEVTDETLVVELPATHWHAVCRAGLDAHLLDRAEVAGAAGVLRVVAIALDRTRRSSTVTEPVRSA